ncbi:c-type cytochrome [Cohaesibacter celericrescens]|uniref:Cytochrome C n=1 Tax=Cohaesibacter celericrescens TaxID=2067669 RepID=A0A2N5XP68_9HYPH|nr:cytochrome c [Cohaesibacter celericrescens]PLW76275.1 cytochrome C [Cohaesibacter celericrescens]
MRKIALAAVALSLFAAPALAGPNEDAVAARQGHYKLLNANMGALAAMAKGEVDYDAAQAQIHADNLALLSKNNIGFLFIPGTSSTDMPGVTRAKAEIWEDFPAVGAAGAKLVEAAMNLQAEAGKGRGELGAALGAAGASCGNCHKSFREK